jgi:hypothetical protein
MAIYDSFSTEENFNEPPIELGKVLLFPKIDNNGEPIIVFKSDDQKFYYLKSGTSYIPHVDENGNLSWSNNDGKENPQPVNIRGEKGGIFTPTIDEDCNLSWSNDAGLENPQSVNLKPIAGKDFFTEEDKQEIVQQVRDSFTDTSTYSKEVF